MSFSGKLNIVGYIGVSPVESLEKTANLVGKSIGHINFEKDETGYFDEYPAYCAYVLGLRLALLGIPDEEDYLGDDPLDYYELQISTLTKGEKDIDLDLSEHIVGLLKEFGNLKCWVLN